MKSAVSLAVMSNRAVSRVGRRAETPLRLRSRSRSPRTAPVSAPPPTIHSVTERLSPERTAAKAGAVSASQIRWAAPATSRQWASPAPTVWLLRSAVTTPTLDRPYQIGMYSMRLGMKSATTWPRPIPRPRAQLA